MIPAALVERTRRWFGALMSSALLAGSLVAGGVADAVEPVPDPASEEQLLGSPPHQPEDQPQQPPVEAGGVPDETGVEPGVESGVEPEPDVLGGVLPEDDGTSPDDPYPSAEVPPVTAADAGPSMEGPAEPEATVAEEEAPDQGPGDDKAVSGNVLPGASIIVNLVVSGAVGIDVTVYAENSGQARKSIEIVAPAPVGSTGVTTSSDPRVYADYVLDDGGLLPSGTYRIIITNLSTVSLMFTYEIGTRSAQSEITPVTPRPGAGLLVGAIATFGGEPLPEGATGLVRVTDPNRDTETLPLHRVGQYPERWQVHFGNARLGVHVIYAEFSWPGGSASRVWSLDNQSSDIEAPPMVIETTPAATNPRGWFARPVAGTLTAADPGSGTRTLELRIDGGAWDVVEGSIIHFSLEHGRHTLEYRATDWAGNSTALRTRTIDIDTVAPTFIAVVPEPGGQYELGSRHEVEVQCEDDLSLVFECRTSAPPGNMLPTGTLGEHTLQVTVADRAGNFVQVPITYTVVEKALPLVEATVPAPDGDGGWFRSAPTVTLSAAEGTDVAGIRWQVAVDGGAPESGGADGNRATFTPARDGVTSFTFWGVDGEGVEGEPQTLTLRVDSEAPVVQVRTGPGPFLLGEDVEADFACADATSGPVLCEGTVAAGELLPTGALGTHLIVVTATDAAGHRTVSEFAYEVVAVLPPPGDPHEPGHAPGSGRLPWTGAAPGAAIAIATALVLAGSAALLARRTAARG